jgi:exopolysaccharide biosynthesis polyprenyl glycosylphosphotransferase
MNPLVSRTADVAWSERVAAKLTWVSTVGIRRPRLLNHYWHNSHQASELWRSADIIVAFTALLGVSLATNAQYVERGLESFITVRVTPTNVLLLCCFIISWPIIFSLFGLYDAARLRTPRVEALRVIGASSTVSATTVLLLLTGEGNTLRSGSILLFLLFTIVGTLSLRHVTRLLVAGQRVSSPRQVLIVGSGPRALKMYRELVAHPRSSHEVVGFVDSTDSVTVVDPDVQARLLGTLDEFESILMQRTVDAVLIALPIRSCYQRIQETIATCERVGVESCYLADVFQCALARPEYQGSASAPVVALKVVQDDLRLIVKRGIDIVAASVGLVVLSPLLLAIALLIKLTSPGPVLFTQQRYGYNRRLFHMYKFRTMVANAETLQITLEHLNEAGGPVFKIKQDPRITPIGRFLRRTSLDEIPQLINVLKGNMSLVGPRPLPIRDVSHFNEAWLMRRFSVLPGITCLWQISGRSNLGFDDWVTLDLAYIDRWSLRLDFQILLSTIPAVLKGTGAV